MGTGFLPAVAMRRFLVGMPQYVEQGLGLGASFYGARFTAVMRERHEIAR
jgi:hypothetical protein